MARLDFFRATGFDFEKDVEDFSSTTFLSACLNGEYSFDATDFDVGVGVAPGITEVGVVPGVLALAIGQSLSLSKGVVENAKVQFDFKIDVGVVVGVDVGVSMEKSGKSGGGSSSPIELTQVVDSSTDASASINLAKKIAALTSCSSGVTLPSAPTNPGGGGVDFLDLGGVKSEPESPILSTSISKG